MSKADDAFDIDENAFVLDQFNLKAATQTYKMCCGDKADLWLSQLEPPKPEKAEKLFNAKEKDTGLSLFEFLS